MRDAGRLEDADRLQRHVRPDALEETRAAAQQDRHEVQLQLVEQPGGEIFVDHVRAPADKDVLVTGGRPSLLERGRDAIGHEGVGRVREGQRLSLVMGEDEDRLVEGWIVAPPALPGIVAPGTTGRWAELAAAHDLGADVRVFLSHDRIAVVLLPALHAVELAPDLEHDEPVVQALTALTEWVLHALVGAGDAAVEGCRDVRSYLAHAPIRHDVGPVFIGAAGARGWLRRPDDLVEARVSHRRPSSCVRTMARSEIMVLPHDDGTIEIGGRTEVVQTRYYRSGRPE